MKKRLALCLCLGLSCTPAFTYKLFYAEQLYELYHRHLYQDSDNTMENIVWLEEALKAPFANPLYALARIENADEWRHYRYLFKMHVNLVLVKLYMNFGRRYNTQVAYFYNEPWKVQNLESLDTAEKLFRLALYYWDQAVSWSRKLNGSPHHLEEVQYWEDENHRIKTGELDYRDIIGEHLQWLEEVRRDFLSMDDETY